MKKTKNKKGIYEKIKNRIKRINQLVTIEAPLEIILNEIKQLKKEQKFYRVIKNRLTRISHFVMVDAPLKLILNEVKQLENVLNNTEELENFEKDYHKSKRSKNKNMSTGV